MKPPWEPKPWPTPRYEVVELNGWVIGPTGVGARKPTTTWYVFDNVYGYVVGRFQSHREQQAREFCANENERDQLHDLIHA
jgi:hypothetical protein